MKNVSTLNPQYLGVLFNLRDFSIDFNGFHVTIKHGFHVQRKHDEQYLKVM